MSKSAVLCYQHLWKGEIDCKQFLTELAVTWVGVAAAAGAAYAGGLIGGAVGGIFGPLGAMIGAVVGSAVAAYPAGAAGASLGKWIASWCLWRMAEKSEEDKNEIALYAALSQSMMELGLPKSILPS